MKFKGEINWENKDASGDWQCIRILRRSVVEIRKSQNKNDCGETEWIVYCNWNCKCLLTRTKQKNTLSDAF